MRQFKRRASLHGIVKQQQIEIDRARLPAPAAAPAEMIFNFLQPREKQIRRQRDVSNTAAPFRNIGARRFRPTACVLSQRLASTTCIPAAWRSAATAESNDAGGRQDSIPSR